MGAQVKTPFLEHSFYFVRMPVGLELSNLRLIDLPNPDQHAEMIDKVVQDRRNVVETRAAQPALITAGDVKDVLQEVQRSLQLQGEQEMALGCSECAKTKPTRSRVSAADFLNSCRRFFVRLICQHADWARAVEAYLSRDGSLPCHSYRLGEK